MCNVILQAFQKTYHTQAWWNIYGTPQTIVLTMSANLEFKLEQHENRNFLIKKIDLDKQTKLLINELTEKLLNKINKKQMD